MPWQEVLGQPPARNHPGRNSQGVWSGWWGEGSSDAESGLTCDKPSPSGSAEQCGGLEMGLDP